MNRPRCGRCRGLGSHHPIGLGPDVECEDCGGTGEKQPKRSRKISVDYERAADSCIYEGRVDGVPCSGRKTWDHVVRRSTLIDYIAGANRNIDVATAKVLQVVLADERNLVPACLGHNLLRETGHPAAQPQPTDLHPHFWDFVAEHNLEGLHPRYLEPPRHRPAGGNPDVAPGRRVGDRGSLREDEAA